MCWQLSWANWKYSIGNLDCFISDMNKLEDSFLMADVAICAR